MKSDIKWIIGLVVEIGRAFASIFKSKKPTSFKKDSTKTK